MVRTKAKQWLIPGLALLFGLVILFISVSPVVNRIALGIRPRYSASPDAIHQAAILHLLTHIVVFGVTAGVAWVAAGFASESLQSRMLAVVLTFLLGCATEYLQHAVYGNTIEVYDVITNICASGTVFVVLAIWEYRKRS